MQEIITGLLPGMPLAAVLFYQWVTIRKDHVEERGQWRALIEKRDERITQHQETTNKLISEVKKLTYIIEKYVIADRKTTDRE
ncbi:MAG: hypothetical protein LBR65_03860 [Culturomica sp.]|jgi:septal ring factor EnvC (AmiA/AmiB activator)|nr:hypothetical protein [Culturomica sp.]